MVHRSLIRQDNILRYVNYTVLDHGNCCNNAPFLNVSQPERHVSRFHLFCYRCRLLPTAAPAPDCCSRLPSVYPLIPVFVTWRRRSAVPMTHGQFNIESSIKPQPLCSVRHS